MLSIIYWDVACYNQWQRRCVEVKTIDGQMMRCLGTGKVLLRVDEVSEVLVDVVVVDKSPLGFKCILGMNAIEELGGGGRDHL